MTNQKILEIAMRQSAIDANCDAADFLSHENKVVISAKSPSARAYLELPFYCCAWSNLGSAKNAMRSGFRPAWVETTAKSAQFVDKLNKQQARRTNPIAM